MYFITCFEKCKTHHELGFFDGGDSRCFGYYEYLYDAVKALKENRCDMHEYIYWYAVIEKIGEGIHPTVEREYWFKYDKEQDGFFKIKKPKETRCVCNHALG